jgi:hypothetical protein
MFICKVRRILILRTLEIKISKQTHKSLICRKFSIGQKAVVQ